MQTFKEEKLTPCPFCNGKVNVKMNGLIEFDKTQVWRVQCKRCGANSGDYYTEEDAVNAWERRIHYLELCEKQRR